MTPVFMTDYLPILQHARTTVERDLLKETMARLTESLFGATSSVFDKQLDSAGMSLVAAFKEVFTIAGAGHSDHDLPAGRQEKIREVLVDISKALDELPIVSLTLAFEPSGKMVEKIYSFLTTTLQKPIVADIKIEPLILGGAIVEYGGVYKDVSLKTKIDKTFREGVTWAE